MFFVDAYTHAFYLRSLSPPNPQLPYDNTCLIDFHFYFIRISFSVWNANRDDYCILIGLSDRTQLSFVFN